MIEQDISCLKLIIVNKKQSPDNNIHSEYYIKALFSLEPTPSASKLGLLRFVLYVTRGAS